MSDLIELSQKGAVLTLTLNRPEKYNAINDAMLATLYAEVRRFAVSDDIQVLLIRANGRYFSAGADLNSGLVPDFSSRSPRAIRSWLRGSERSLTPLGELMEAIEKPVVVAHNGPCIGGALELSLSCDFRLAADSAAYYLPETRLGAVPNGGGTARLTRMIGPHWARWMLIAGKTIDATKAEAIGLVHAVYPQAEFDVEVDAFCQSLAEMPPEAIGATKIAIELVADLGSAAARNVERIATSALVFGDELEACMAAAQQRVSPT
ncbi:enoyl-CoA hydratase/isomerase family protein [Sphingobium sp. YR768]|uniref:enoyl-CoA hydratase/isomerase family protein n=1 Tax=Sphingobium sp. YR768 TaxID=1884365 RepID=UPI0008CFC74B|nr:enoyl-CoA hydratase/isomerase family protein [Sphingobium sp. YR768]SES17201.1 Enoyl-CoA hydratase/carnithine racemase [Sphingobium sp. YR768]